MASRIVQNRLTQPDGTPLAKQRILIKLCVRAFGDGGQREILDQADVYTDDDGMWQADLEVNADLDPAETYYTVREPAGVLWTIKVPAGSGAVSLRTCVVVPLAPPPAMSFVLPDGGVPGQFVGLLPDGTIGWLDAPSSTSPPNPPPSAAVVTSPTLTTSPTLVTSGA